MITVFGTTDTKDNAHIDTSNTLRGAKMYATRNGLKTVSKRVGSNAYVIAEKRRGKWYNTKTTMKDVVIYDNGGETIDSITFAFLNTAEDDIFGTRLYTYECLSTSYNGVAVWMHSYCQIGSHLGKKVELKDLDKDLQEKFIEYLNEL